MIPTISFGSLVGLVLGAYLAGCLTGAAILLWLYKRLTKKK